MQKIVMRLVATSQHHQLGQFPVPPKDVVVQPPDLEPITSIALVAQAKKEGTEDINHPLWRDAPNADLKINYGKPELLADIKPGREFIVTIEAAPEKADGTIN